MDMEESYSSDKVRSCSSHILTYDVGIPIKEYQILCRLIEFINPK